MGWDTYANTTRRAVWDRHFGEPWTNPLGQEVRVEGPTERGWAWWGLVHLDGEPHEVVLMRFDGGDHPDRLEEVTAKIESECVGPCVFTCPLELLDATPEPTAGSWAAHFRIKTREWAAGEERRKSAAAG